MLNSEFKPSIFIPVTSILPVIDDRINTNQFKYFSHRIESTNTHNSESILHIYKYNQITKNFVSGLIFSQWLFLHLPVGLPQKTSVCQTYSNSYLISFFPFRPTIFIPFRMNQFRLNSFILSTKSSKSSKS